LYEQEGFALFQTIYYGGIKKYQWVNIPLMLSGRIDTKDGKTISIEIGRNPQDPILIIPDAAPHVDSPLRKREYTGVMEGEEMDPIIGTIPDQKNSIINTVMSALSSTYNFTEEDLVSAELNITPAGMPRDVGLDRSLIGSYGQDDRACSYVAIKSLMDLETTPMFTSMAYIVDNEETGNVNNTGASSSFLTKVYGIIAEAQNASSFNENVTRKALSMAKVISADANDGISPLFPGLSERTNASRLGFGPSIKRYGRSFDANSEFTAWIRNILDSKSIPWQTASYKVETGGGGTIGGQMSKEDMEVIDIGIPLLSMHSPFEIASKIDIWNLNRFFTEFYKAQ
jgi:aspartyl aminopeptidase